MYRDPKGRTTPRHPGDEVNGNLSRLYHTVKYLKPIQIYYRIFYALRRKVRGLTRFKYPENQKAEGTPLVWKHTIPAFESFHENNHFEFLNLAHTFGEKIDWNFPDHGKLWTYNLTYFDYLHQPNMDRERGLALINDFIDAWDELKDALEPFPTSLRGINWIKFLAKHGIRDATIDGNLRAQYAILADNLEYHLLGNHLLENGFSLLFGAWYFRDETLLELAEKILLSQLEEQILSDGGHFELSPMYHQIMLYRVLDCIQLLQFNAKEEEGNELLSFLKEKASGMTGWLHNITFEDGTIPMCNDAAADIAPTTFTLMEYAKYLGITKHPGKLSESGYRKYVSPRYEMVYDMGKIGPDYQPGHAHSDTFSFVLYVDGKPFIVDTGTSTYEAGFLRQSERSTAAHNTVSIDDLDQSEVWGGFRVARRAYVHTVEDNEDGAYAWHDGYLQRLGVKHYRKVKCEEHKISIEDIVTPSGSNHKCVARLHFHPDTTIEVRNNIVYTDSVTIETDGDVQIFSYDLALSFNRRAKANGVMIEFQDSLKTDIVFNKSN
jgi:hypothetical protein